MTFDDLNAQLGIRPFEPFRLYLTDGTTFDIRHPELFMLGRRSVIIGLAAKPEQKHYDRWTTVDLFHIMRTEPLPPAATTNGPPTAAG
jgi:hypothetical protein